MSLKCFLLDLVARIEFLEFDRDEVLLNIGVVVLVTNVVAEEMQFLMLVIDQFQDELLYIFLVLRQFLVGVQTGCKFEKLFCELFGNVLGDELQIEIAELLQVESQQQELFDIIFVFNAYASLFQDLLDLFNEFLRELSFFIFFLEFVIGLGENLLEGSSLEGEGAFIGRNQDVILDSAFDAALTNVEGVVRVVVQVHFFVLFLHS